MRARKESEDDDRVIMDRMDKRRSLNSCETRENGRKRSSLTTSISSFLNYKLCVCARKFCVSEHAFTIRLYNYTTCVTFHLRIANRVGEDSCCRGGIVHTRGGRSGSFRKQMRHCSKALWQFRASISNSLSGLSWPHSHTPVRHIHHTYAQQDIRVCGDDPFQPPLRQYSNPKALSLLRVSI